MHMYGVAVVVTLAHADIKRAEQIPRISRTWFTHEEVCYFYEIIKTDAWSIAVDIADVPETRY